MSFFDSVRRVPFHRGPQRLLGGLAGGVSARLGWNVWLVRLLIVVASLLPVIGWVAYVVVWVVTPWQDGSIPVERWLGRRW